MEKFLHSHKPHPAGYPFSYPYPPPFSKGPTLHQFRMPSLAQNLRPACRVVVRVDPLKWRGIREDFPRTREGISSEYNRRSRSPRQHDDHAFSPHQPNQISLFPLRGMGEHPEVFRNQFRLAPTFAYPHDQEVGRFEREFCPSTPLQQRSKPEGVSLSLEVVVVTIIHPLHLPKPCIL